MIANPSSEHAPSMRVVVAQRALLWGEDERRALDAMLREFGEKVYLRTIVAELQRQQVPLTTERIAQVRASWSLVAQHRAADIAADHARSITATHNRLLSAAIDRILGEHPTYNRVQLTHALARTEDALTVWKARQINETERFAFYQAAFEDFYRANSDLAALFEFGGSLQCAVCQEVAAANPYTLGAMMSVDDPPHVGCLDVWTPLG